MKTHYKLLGNPTKTFIEFNLDFSRWLIGFGWSVLAYRYFHFNLGPFAIIIGWPK